MSQTTQQNSFFTRIWRSLEERLPTLSRSEQSAVYKDMRHNAQADVDFYVLITLASIIAYYGLLQNSAAVIIGAMLVAPLMSPMIAMANAVVMGNLHMLRRAATSTLAGIAIAIGISALFTWLLPSLPPGSEIMGRTQPTLLDLIVALASGAAAAYALARKEVAAALPGVAIAAALVPPLCVVGYGIGSFRWHIASGAGLLFLTNLASIILAGAVMFLLLGFRPTHDEQEKDVRRGLRYAIIGLLIVFIPLAISTVTIARQTRMQSTVQNILLEDLPVDRAEIENIAIEQKDNGLVVGFTAYLYEDQNYAEVIEEIRQTLKEAVDAPVTLRVRVVDSTLASIDETGIHTSPDVAPPDGSQ
ncbi:MAG: TIGR00341 family protein [Caldilineaceae bacterium]|nr:TIGR00341 family protein [Caldilineaceae bacterium]